MKILILGGTGVLSSDILCECLDKGDEVYIINRGNHVSSPYSSQRNSHVIIGNVRMPETFIGKIQNLSLDVIVDCLSYTPEQLRVTWKALADLCKHYIFISSCCVFRRSVEDGIISESSPKPNHYLDYSINKYACENELHKLSVNAQCKYTIVRPYITYGSTRIPFGIAPYGRMQGTILSRIRQGKPMFLWDDGKARCTLLHAKDFAKIFHYLLLNKKAFGESVNLTGGTVYTWKEVLLTIYKCLSIKPNYVSIDKNDLAKSLPAYKGFILGDRALDAVFDNEKLYQIVPEAREIQKGAISLESGIKDSISAYDNNNMMDGMDYIYDAMIDRAISQNCNDKDYLRLLIYKNYLNSNRLKDKLLYSLFRYFPYRFATMIQTVYLTAKRILEE